MRSFPGSVRVSSEVLYHRPVLLLAPFVPVQGLQSYQNRKLLPDVLHITLQFEDDSELSCPVDGIFDFGGNSYMIVRDPDSPDLIAFGYKEVHTIDGFELSNLDEATHDRVINAYRRR